MENELISWLPEVGETTLGKLSFGGHRGTHEMTKDELPANIKDFESIEICAQEDQIDSALMTTFFTNIRPILSIVNLWCNYDHNFETCAHDNRVPDFLNELLPLIDSINSIHFFDCRAVDLVHEQFADKFFAAKVVSINYKFIMEKDYWPGAAAYPLRVPTIPAFQERIWKPKMAILRKWLLFNGNGAANNVDQPRILYVDKISFDMCREEITNISNDFKQSTKPTQFIVCFTLEYLDDERRHYFEELRLPVNQTTNEQLSIKCFGEFGAVFLHSHPILANGEEHEGNMRLINQIVESLPWDKMEMEKKFVYSPNRHINIYREEFMQSKSTKPTPFIVCFITSILREEQSHGFEEFRHVNKTTNEQLSVKCVVIHSKDEDYYETCAVFLHSHPKLANDDEEHEGNMQLIDQIVETFPMEKMEDKFVYSTNRHINIYMPGRKRRYGEY